MADEPPAVDIDDDVPEPRGAPGAYIHYVKARALLSRRLGATPEEIAVWTWLGNDAREAPAEGIDGYLDPEEHDGQPPRFLFRYDVSDDFKYLPQLMACYYRLEDVQNFQPKHRYLTFDRVIVRFSSFCTADEAVALIRNKSHTGELESFHPLTGGTAETKAWGNEEGFPPLGHGLFLVAQVEAIEAELTPDAASTGAMKGITPKEFIAKHATRVQGKERFLDKWFKGKSRVKGEKPPAARFRIPGSHGRYDEVAMVAALKEDNVYSEIGY